MLKEVILSLTAIMIIITFTGCDRNRESELATASVSMANVFSETQTETIIEPEVKKYILSDDQVSAERNCRLVVNGKDITNNNYVRINVEDKSAEIPLLASMRALGAEVKKQDSDIVLIILNGHSVAVDTSELNFGVPIPPGGTRAVRKIVNNDLIFNDNSIRTLFSNIAGAEINIDYDNMIVNIDET